MYLSTIMLLGSGELGREVVIAAKRLGCRVIACDAYDDAPAMQFADAREVFSMLDGAALRAAVEKHRPDHIIPEIEAIDTAMLGELEAEGWHVVPFAVEAVIDPRRHNLKGAEHRQLRRFLRKAEGAGLTFGPITFFNDTATTEIYTAWEDTHGAERGLTMGRFCPLYLRDKPLFGAWLNGELVAFASWLQAPGVLSLDVMRHLADLPQGTMHGLIQAVIEKARADGLHEVNLAALPHPELPERIADCAGLARFKTSFAPSWRPLYIGAPNPVSLAISAADIRLAILRPAPLQRSQQDLWDLDALIEPEPEEIMPLRNVG